MSQYIPKPNKHKPKHKPKCRRRSSQVVITAQLHATHTHSLSRLGTYPRAPHSLSYPFPHRVLEYAEHE